MQIEYNSKKMRKLCTDAGYAEKEYSKPMARKIQQRINEMTSADSVEFMINNFIGRCHKLKGDRKDQYAVDLVQPYRMVFEKIGDDIEIVNIMEIVDYH